MKPLCFVLMPFGKKQSASGITVNFDSVYNDLIVPAIKQANLEPLRADEEMVGGIIHKPMYERLILCEYAIADLTNANANVFYELGVRHAVRPWSTILIFAEGINQLPFDVAPLRALPYRLTSDGIPEDITNVKDVLAQRLTEARSAKPDSPIFQLVENYPDIDHTKTDVFRDRVHYSNQIKEKLTDARKRDKDTIKNIQNELGNIGDIEAGIIIDLFLSYRSIKAWQEMIDLVKDMSLPLSSTVMVQEQLALALNRNGKGEKAEQILLDLINKRGPSSETYGILGRVYKDRWESVSKQKDDVKNQFLAKGILKNAIEAYIKGFETDWRDAYPGINAVTLMEFADTQEYAQRQKQLIPVISYSVERKIAAGKTDYWDHATLLELAVIAKDQKSAEQSLSDALASVREPWESETTSRNLRLIRESRERKNEHVEDWQKQIEESLSR